MNHDVTMWKLAYAVLLVARLFFALSPSYIHPDEHFQGPEVVAGELFKWHSQQTWEFTSDRPIRSFFPLWVAYALPMKAAAWLSGASGPTPDFAFKALRVSFCLLSVLLEDTAFYQLVPNGRLKGWALVLLSSSYVTWTFQTHTFSNSVETILLLWSLVLLERIRKSKFAKPLSSAMLGFICIFGTFNRITFPAFLLLPGLKAVPYLLGRTTNLAPLILAAGVTAAYAIQFDTRFYRGSEVIITPLNNLMYNTQTSNLAQHGLHPRITHLFVNLPQLLGPALICVALGFSRRQIASLPILSAISGLAILSILPHQEARFLIPCVPLLLTEVRLPQRKRLWIASWVIFNLALGTLMGLYHQAGIVPAQDFLARHTNATDILYWKTYMPPTWLLGPASRPIRVVDVPSPVHQLVDTLHQAIGELETPKELYLVAPLSATALDPLTDNPGNGWRLERVWATQRHLNLDDLDIGDDGLGPTIGRVIGRRGLAIWRVDKTPAGSLS
ncbi:GPI mannosyltransferase 4 [Coprinopsis sp. MPI-PUGE-AT-0042]|nr:GPI mannosyltransferase 4 [Coprinopsis sp. MPI-PUGE-AT-0042]